MRLKRISPRFLVLHLLNVAPGTKHKVFYFFKAGGLPSKQGVQRCRQVQPSQVRTSSGAPSGSHPRRRIQRSAPVGEIPGNERGTYPLKDNDLFHSKPQRVSSVGRTSSLLRSQVGATLLTSVGSNQPWPRHSVVGKLNPSRAICETS